MTVAFIAVAGCGGKTYDLRGTYDGGLKAISIEHHGSDMSFAGLVSYLRIQITDERHYTMSGLPGTLVTGHYELKGTQLRLTPERISGLSVADWKKQNPRQGSSELDLDSTINATLDQEDGTIKFPDSDKDTGWRTVFRKEVPVDESKLPTTVRPEESAFTGSYHGPSPLPQLKSGGTSTSNGDTTLRLYRDNSFRMNYMSPVMGTWRIDKGKIILSPTLAAGVLIRDLSPDNKGSLEFQLTPSKDGKKLTLHDESWGKDIVLKKSG